jgi:hypothetical protein
MPGKTTTSAASGLVRQALDLASQMKPSEFTKFLERAAYELRLPITLFHPGIPGVSITAEFWTIEQAEASLAVNNKNRVKRERVITAYERNIVSEQWPFTGDSVAFDIDGELVDGQHRGAAIKAAYELALEAGMAEDEARTTVGIWTLVVRGLEPDIRNYKDLHTARTDRDRLDLEGLPNAAKLGPIARWAVSYRATTSTGSPGTSSYQPTPAEVLDFVLGPQRDTLVECAAFAQDLGGRAPELHLMPRVAGFARWLFMQFDAETGRQFMEWVATGTAMDQTNPAYKVRKLFMAQYTNAARRLLRGRDKLTGTDQLGLLIIAFNVFQGQGDMDSIELPQGGFRARNMPRFVHASKLNPATKAAANGTVPKAAPVVFAAP